MHLNHGRVLVCELFWPFTSAMSVNAENARDVLSRLKLNTTSLGICWILTSIVFALRCYYHHSPHWFHGSNSCVVVIIQSFQDRLTSIYVMEFQERRKKALYHHTGELGAMLLVYTLPTLKYIALGLIYYEQEESRLVL